MSQRAGLAGLVLFRGTRVGPPQDGRRDEPRFRQEGMMLEVLPAAVTARRYYRLVDERDFAAVVGLFTPDCTYRRPGYDPIVGSVGLRRFFEHDRPIVDGRHDVTAIVADGDRIAVQGEFHGELRNGAPVDLRFVDFFELAPDGRFARWDTFFYAPVV